MDLSYNTMSLLYKNTVQHQIFSEELTEVHLNFVILLESFGETVGFFFF